MAALGKSIRVFLADGSPSGIRHAELVNWTGQAIVCPRGRVPELAQWGETRRPGVYLLVGEDPEGLRPNVYIGEAENVFLRLQSHIKNKELWREVILFTSKDENLTKAHVKFLEARLFVLATEAGRTQLENAVTPQAPALPRADRDAMEEFLDPLRVLLGTLGFSFLNPLSQPAPNAESAGVTGRRLCFNPNRDAINAAGSVTDEGFVVFAGATGDAEVRSHLGKGYSALREQLLADGSLVVEGNLVRFARDVLFSSPSAAAAVIAGGAYNGREAWKDESGRMLKELEEEVA